MQTQINLKTLAAVAIAASKEETRYYLNGVLVECRADHVMYVATDGHRLLVVREDVPEASRGEERALNTLIGDFIIPAEICRAYKPAKRDYLHTATLTQEPDKALRLASVGAGARVFKPIDGTFPDWRRVIPRELSGKHEFDVKKKDQAGEFTVGQQGAIFNPDYLSSFGKFGEAMGVGKPEIAWNAENPAGVVYPSGNVLGVLMPIRASSQSELLNRWHARFDALITPVSEPMLQAAE